MISGLVVILGLTAALSWIGLSIAIARNDDLRGGALFLNAFVSGALLVGQGSGSVVMSATRRSRQHPSGLAKRLLPREAFA